MKQSGLSRLVHHEVSVWCTAIFTAIAGHGAANTLLEALEGHAGALALAAWMVVFLGITFIFYLAYAIPLRSRLPRTSRIKVLAKGFVPWILTAVAGVLLWGVATAIHRRLSGEPFRGALFAGYLAGFFVCAAFLYVRRNSVLTVHSRYVEQQAISGAKRGHLILMLSHVEDETLAETGWFPRGVTWSDPPDLEADLKAIKDVKKPGERNWPWEMPLRAIQEQLPVVGEITLVCSPDSIRQAPAFCERVRRYGRLDVAVWCARDGILSRVVPAADPLQDCAGFDFARRLDDVSAAVTDLLNDMHFVRGIDPREIMVDFTGGQKPVSFVAAAATLRGEVLAQYVDTRELKTIVYDLVTNAEARVGG
jgi:hypothetical protein